MALTLRPPTPADIEPCRIIYDAFRDIALRHGFPPDFPEIEMANGVAGMLIGSSSVFGVVAEQDGRVLGSNFLAESNAIRGVGPITVDPVAQGNGVGRRLMEAVIERARSGWGAAHAGCVQFAILVAVRIARI